MKKNTIVTIVVAAMVAASLSACGAKSEAPAETPAVVEEVAEEVTPEVEEVAEEVTPEVEEVAEEVTPEVEEETPVEEEEEGLMLPDSNLKFKSLNGVQPEIDPRDDAQIMYSSDDFFRAYCMSPVLVGDAVSVEKDYEELNKAFVELESSFVVD